MSCASPLGIGTLGGVVGVGAASVAAGEAAEVCGLVVKDVRGRRKLGRGGWDGSWNKKKKKKNQENSMMVGVLHIGKLIEDACQDTVDFTRVYARSFGKIVEERYGGLTSSKAKKERNMLANQMLIDALLGAVAFKVTGGSFRSVMPSDLVKPGAIARESIPAAGMQYATDEKRRELIRMFRRDGCHHCGTTKGAVVGDHMPPNKHVVQKAEAWATQFMDRVTKIGAVRRALLGMGIHPDVQLRQRYYPQCVGCSQKQAVAVRHDRSARVMHTVLHKGGKGGTGWHYVGVWVGLGRNIHE
jgi:hypothetical protein